MSETEEGGLIAQPSDFERFDKCLRNKIVPNKKVAIFTHATPDPDAMGAMRGMQFLLMKVYGLEADCFYDGEVSHPQNRTTVKLLDINLMKVDTYNPQEYFFNILVDTVPANAGLGGKQVAFDVCVDHHKEVPNGNFAGLAIHHHTGSVCGIVYDMLKQAEVEFDDESEECVRIATSLLVGVITDTDNCMSSDTTYRDFKAQQELFQFRDADALRKIVRFNRPMSWIKHMGTAIHDVKIDTDAGVAAVGIGLLDEEQRDVIADIASGMLTWGNVQTAIVFAWVGGDRIEGSVRTNDDTVEVQALCSKLAGRHGSGGGKRAAGGYRKSLGCLQLEVDEDDELKEQKWLVIKRNELNTIFKLIKK